MDTRNVSPFLDGVGILNGRAQGNHFQLRQFILQNSAFEATVGHADFSFAVVCFFIDTPAMGQKRRVKAWLPAGIKTVPLKTGAVLGHQQSDSGGEGLKLLYLAAPLKTENMYAFFLAMNNGQIV